MLLWSLTTGAAVVHELRKTPNVFQGGKIALRMVLLLRLLPRGPWERAVDAITSGRHDEVVYVAAGSALPGRGILSVIVPIVPSRAFAGLDLPDSSFTFKV